MALTTHFTPIIWHLHAENEGVKNILMHLDWNASCPFNIKPETSYYIVMKLQ